jgi:hypothetical protein
VGAEGGAPHCQPLAKGSCMPKTGCWWLNGSFRFVILLPLVSILVQLDIGFDENEGRKDGGPSLWRPRERSPRHGRMQGLLDCRHLPPVHISDAKVQNVRLRTSFPKPCSVILVHMRCTAEGVRAAGSLVAMNPLGSRCGLETQMYTYPCHAMIKSLSANSFNRNS